ncbi:MAG: HRDC domain-containing protein [Alistipes sp.]|nr:HRDC domain-containing protein [Alistipes sp.]
MQIKIFDLTSRGGDETQDLINKFLRGHKILDIDRQFYVSSDNVGHWSLLVTYLPSVLNPQAPERKEKKDYKEILSSEAFERFTHLRVIRRQLAMDDAVPAYAVFTDAELAQIAQLPSIEPSLMSQITGIGDKRMDKYGRILCEMYKEQSNETNR